MSKSKIILTGISVLIITGCIQSPAVPSQELSKKFKTFHNGYDPKNLIGTSNCAGVFPQAILDYRTRGTTTKEKITSISWSGQCDSGLMHGQGMIKIKAKAGNVNYIYLIGEMNHGFMEGNVRYIAETDSGSKSSKELYIRLDNYSDYVKYETPRAYNSSSNDSGIDASLLVGAAVVAGIAAMYNSSKSTSSSTSSTYSSSYEPCYGEGCYVFVKTKYSSEDYRIRCTKGPHTGKEYGICSNGNGKWAMGCGVTDSFAHHYNSADEAANERCKW